MLKFKTDCLNSKNGKLNFILFLFLTFPAKLVSLVMNLLNNIDCKNAEEFNFHKSM